MTAIRLRGSPDLAAPVSVSIKLRKRKATTMTMQRTGNTGVSYVPEGDALEAELLALRATLAATDSPEAKEKAWRGGMGGRVARLPPADKAAFEAEYKAHRPWLPAEAPPVPA